MLARNSFHVVGHDKRGAVVLRQKWSRGQVETRLANLPPCLIGVEACVGAHHLSRKLQLLGHDARLITPSWADIVAKRFCPSDRTRLIQVEARMRNIDSNTLPSIVAGPYFTERLRRLLQQYQAKRRHCRLARLQAA
jgi:transposase